MSQDLLRRFGCDGCGAAHVVERDHRLGSPPSTLPAGWWSYGGLDYCEACANEPGGFRERLAAWSAERARAYRENDVDLNAMLDQRHKRAEAWLAANPRPTPGGSDEA